MSVLANAREYPATSQAGAVFHSTCAGSEDPLFECAKSRVSVWAWPKEFQALCDIFSWEFAVKHCPSKHPISGF